MISYLNFPPVPKHLTDKLSRNIDDYPNSVYREWHFDGHPGENRFIRSDDGCEELSKWCKENISDDVEWGVQLYVGSHMPLHVDPGYSVKLSFIVDLGGDNAVTEFFDKDMNLVYSRVIEPNRWFLIKTDVLHQVRNIESHRFTVTSAILPYHKTHIMPKN